LTFIKDSKFNQPINNLPSGLKSLTFDYIYLSSFNQPINKLPKGLQHLVLPKNYDKPTDHLSKFIKNKKIKYD